MIKIINNYVFKLRLKSAIKRANEWHKLTDATYLVILKKRKPIVVAKQQLKQWIAQKRFKKGVTIQSIEQGALHIAS